MSYFKTWRLEPRKRICWNKSNHVDGEGYYTLEHLSDYKIFKMKFRIWRTVCMVPEHEYKTHKEGIKALLTKYNKIK